MRIASMQRSLLLAMAVGLVPVALSYGGIPETSLPWLYAIEADDVPMRHVFRAIMGLYLGMIVFWLAGALRPTLRVPALWSLFVFTLGLASGRCLSLVFDGWPGLLLFGYLLAEIALAAAAASLLWQSPDQPDAS